MSAAPSPGQALWDMTGWQRVTCEESDKRRAEPRTVVSTLTDPAGTCGPAVVFTEWGAACQKAGLRFGYHPHGLEFKPTAAGQGETMFDILLRETKADLVTYEMDVYWAFYAGQDPAKLLAKHPTRWSLIHVKDMLKGLATGVHTGNTPPTGKVTVGQGQLNWPEILAAAQKIGVQHYFLEDETPTPLQCIPDSFKYLRALKL